MLDLRGGTTWFWIHRHGACSLRFGDSGWVGVGAVCFKIFLVDVDGVGVDDGEGRKMKWSQWNEVSWKVSSPLHWPLQMPKGFDSILPKSHLHSVEAWDMDFVDCIMVPDGEVRADDLPWAIFLLQVSRLPRIRWFTIQGGEVKKTRLPPHEVECEIL